MYIFAKFTYNEYIRPYFLLHVVSTTFTTNLPVTYVFSVSIFEATSHQMPTQIHMFDKEDKSN